MDLLRSDTATFVNKLPEFERKLRGEPEPVVAVTSDPVAEASDVAAEVTTPAPALDAAQLRLKARDEQRAAAPLVDTEGNLTFEGDIQDYRSQYDRPNPNTDNLISAGVRGFGSGMRRMDDSLGIGYEAATGNESQNLRRDQVRRETDLSAPEQGFAEAVMNADPGAVALATAYGVGDAAPAMALGFLARAAVMGGLGLSNPVGLAAMAGTFLLTSSLPAVYESGKEEAGLAPGEGLLTTLPTAAAHAAMETMGAKVLLGVVGNKPLSALTVGPGRYRRAVAAVGGGALTVAGAEALEETGQRLLEMGRNSLAGREYTAGEVGWNLFDSALGGFFVGGALGGVGGTYSHLTRSQTEKAKERLADTHEKLAFEQPEDAAYGRRMATPHERGVRAWRDAALAAGAISEEMPLREQIGIHILSQALGMEKEVDSPFTYVPTPREMAGIQNISATDPEQIPQALVLYSKLQDANYLAATGLGKFVTDAQGAQQLDEDATLTQADALFGLTRNSTDKTISAEERDALPKWLQSLVVPVETGFRLPSHMIANNSVLPLIGAHRQSELMTGLSPDYSVEEKHAVALALNANNLDEAERLINNASFTYRVPNGYANIRGGVSPRFRNLSPESQLGDQAAQAVADKKKHMVADIRKATDEENLQRAEAAASNSATETPIQAPTNVATPAPTSNYVSYSEVGKPAIALSLPPSVDSTQFNGAFAELVRLSKATNTASQNKTLSFMLTNPVLRQMLDTPSSSGTELDEVSQQLTNSFAATSKNVAAYTAQAKQMIADGFNGTMGSYKKAQGQEALVFSNIANLEAKDINEGMAAVVDHMGKPTLLDDETATLALSKLPSVERLIAGYDQLKKINPNTLSPVKNLIEALASQNKSAASKQAKADKEAQEDKEKEAKERATVTVKIGRMSYKFLNDTTLSNQDFLKVMTMKKQWALGADKKAGETKAQRALRLLEATPEVETLIRDNEELDEVLLQSADRQRLINSEKKSEDAEAEVAKKVMDDKKITLVVDGEAKPIFNKTSYDKEKFKELMGKLLGAINEDVSVLDTLKKHPDLPAFLAEAQKTKVAYISRIDKLIKKEMQENDKRASKEAKQTKQAELAAQAKLVEAQAASDTDELEAEEAAHKELAQAAQEQASEINFIQNETKEEAIRLRKEISIQKKMLEEAADERIAQLKKTVDDLKKQLEGQKEASHQEKSRQREAAIDEAVEKIAVIEAEVKQLDTSSIKQRAQADKTIAAQQVRAGKLAGQKLPEEFARTLAGKKDELSRYKEKKQESTTRNNLLKKQVLTAAKEDFVVNQNAIITMSEAAITSLTETIQQSRAPKNSLYIRNEKAALAGHKTNIKNAMKEISQHQEKLQRLNAGFEASTKELETLTSNVASTTRAISALMTQSRQAEANKEALAKVKKETEVLLNERVLLAEKAASVEADKARLVHNLEVANKQLEEAKKLSTEASVTPETKSLLDEAKEAIEEAKAKKKSAHADAMLIIAQQSPQDVVVNAVPLIKVGTEQYHLPGVTLTSEESAVVKKLLTRRKDTTRSNAWKAARFTNNDVALLKSPNVVEAINNLVFVDNKGDKSNKVLRLTVQSLANIIIGHNTLRHDYKLENVPDKLSRFRTILLGALPTSTFAYVGVTTDGKSYGVLVNRGTQQTQELTGHTLTDIGELAREGTTQLTPEGLIYTHTSGKVIPLDLSKPFVSQIPAALDEVRTSRLLDGTTSSSFLDNFIAAQAQQEWVTKDQIKEHFGTIPASFYGRVLDLSSESHPDSDGSRRGVLYVSIFGGTIKQAEELSHEETAAIADGLLHHFSAVHRAYAATVVGAGRATAVATVNEAVRYLWNPLLARFDSKLNAIPQTGVALSTKQFLSAYSTLLEGRSPLVKLASRLAKQQPKLKDMAALTLGLANALEAGQFEDTYARIPSEERAHYTRFLHALMWRIPELILGRKRSYDSPTLNLKSETTTEGEAVMAKASRSHNDAKFIARLWSEAEHQPDALLEDTRQSHIMPQAVALLGKSFGNKYIRLLTPTVQEANPSAEQTAEITSREDEIRSLEESIAQKKAELKEAAVTQPASLSEAVATAQTRLFKKYAVTDLGSLSQLAAEKTGLLERITDNKNAASEALASLSKRKQALLLSLGTPKLDKLTSIYEANTITLTPALKKEQQAATSLINKLDVTLRGFSKKHITRLFDESERDIATHYIAVLRESLQTIALRRSLSEINALLSNLEKPPTDEVLERLKEKLSIKQTEYNEQVTSTALVRATTGKSGIITTAPEHVSPNNFSGVIAHELFHNIAFSMKKKRPDITMGQLITLVTTQAQRQAFTDSQTIISQLLIKSAPQLAANPELLLEETFGHWVEQTSNMVWMPTHAPELATHHMRNLSVGGEVFAEFKSSAKLSDLLTEAAMQKLETFIAQSFGGKEQATIRRVEEWVNQLAMLEGTPELQATLVRKSSEQDLKQIVATALPEAAIESLKLNTSKETRKAAHAVLVAAARVLQADYLIQKKNLDTGTPKEAEESKVQLRLIEAQLNKIQQVLDTRITSPRFGRIHVSTEGDYLSTLERMFPANEEEVLPFGKILGIKFLARMALIANLQLANFPILRTPSTWLGFSSRPADGLAEGYLLDALAKNLGLSYRDTWAIERPQLSSTPVLRLEENNVVFPFTALSLYKQKSDALTINGQAYALSGQAAMRVLAEQLASRPAKGDVLFSKGKSKGGMTEQAARDVITQFFPNGKAIADTVVYLNQNADVAEHYKQAVGHEISLESLQEILSDEGNIEGFFDTVSGKVFVFLEAVNAKSLPGVVVHEGSHLVGQEVRLANKLLRKEYPEVRSDLTRREAAASDLQAALAGVEQLTPRTLKERLNYGLFKLTRYAQRYLGKLMHQLGVEYQALPLLRSHVLWFISDALAHKASKTRTPGGVLFSRIARTDEEEAFRTFLEQTPGAVSAASLFNMPKDASKIPAYFSLLETIPDYANDPNFKTIYVNGVVLLSDAVVQKNLSAALVKMDDRALRQIPSLKTRAQRAFSGFSHTIADDARQLINHRLSSFWYRVRNNVGAMNTWVLIKLSRNTANFLTTRMMQSAQSALRVAPSNELISALSISSNAPANPAALNAGIAGIKQNMVTLLEQAETDNDAVFRELAHTLIVMGEANIAKDAATYLNLSAQERAQYDDVRKFFSGAMAVESAAIVQHRLRKVWYGLKSSNLQPHTKLYFTFNGANESIDVEVAPVLKAMLNSKLYADVMFELNNGKSLNDIASLVDALKALVATKWRDAVQHELSNHPSGFSSADIANIMSLTGSGKQLRVSPKTSIKVANALFKTSRQFNLVEQRLDEHKAAVYTGFMPNVRFGRYRVVVRKIGAPKSVLPLAEFAYDTTLEQEVAMHSIRGMLNSTDYVVSRALAPEHSFNFNVMSEEMRDIIQQSSENPDDLHGELVAFAEGLKKGKAFDLRNPYNEVVGESLDLNRLMTSTATSVAQRSTAMLYSSRISRAMNDTATWALTDEDNENITEQLRQDLEFTARDFGGRIPTLANARFWMSAMMLGGTVIQGLVQYSTLPTITLPRIGQDIKNASKASVLLLDGLNQFRPGAKNNLTPEEQQLIAIGEQTGLISSRNLADLFSVGNTGSQVSGIINKTWMFPMLAAETHVRKATFLAALRAWDVMPSSTKDEYKKAFTSLQTDALLELYKLTLPGITGNNVVMTKEEEAKILYGINVLATSSGDFSRENRPTWAQGDIGATVFMFQAVVLVLLEHLRANFNKPAFYGTLLALFIISGTDGWPGIDNFMDVLNILLGIGAAAGLDIAPLSKGSFGATVTKEVEGMLDGTGFEDLPQLVRRGLVNYVFGIDFAQKAGFGRILPGTHFLSEGYPSGKLEGELAGVSSNFFDSAVKTTQALSDGDVDAAMRRLPITGIRQLYKASASLLDDSDYRDPNGQLFGKLSNREVIGMFLGAEPAYLGWERTRVIEGLKQKKYTDQIKSDIAKDLAYGSPSERLRAVSVINQWAAWGEEMRPKEATLARLRKSYKQTFRQRSQL